MSALRVLMLDQIQPSKTNPRKRFTEAQMQELTDNIKQHGVMQPILVRPMGKDGRFVFPPNGPEDTTGVHYYEIVAGERRYRASKAAGLHHIPAIIRELHDLEAMQLQVFENLHRDDLHPIEEAEGFQQLLKKSQDLIGLTVDELALQVGKSRAYIYASLKLLDLCEEVRQDFFDGKFSTSVALLIARIPGKKLQKMAADSVHTSDGPMAYRTAARILQDRFTLNLTKAVFDIHDASLKAEAGACDTCPKRSGNCQDITPDITSPDVCTDPDCYAEKRDAHVCKLEMEGKRVITGKEAEEIAPYGDAYLTGGYCKKTSVEYVRGSGEQKTWEEWLGEDLPEPINIVTKDGTVIEAYETKVLEDLLQQRIAAGKIILEPEKPREPSEWEIKRAARDKAMQEEITRRAVIFNAIVAATKDTAALDRNFGNIIKDAIQNNADLSFEACKVLASANGYEGDSPDTFIEEYLSQPRTNQELMAMLIQVMVAEQTIPGYSWNSAEDNEDDEDLEKLKAMASAFGVDPDAPAAEPEPQTADPFKSIKEKELAKRSRRAKKPAAEEVAA